MEQVLSGLLRFVPIVAPFMLSPHVDGERYVSGLSTRCGLIYC